MSVPKNKSTGGLLIAGARSYPQALAAISEFCREVQTVFRTTLNNEIASIAEAMALRITRAEIKNYAWPESFTKEIDGEWATLGVKIDRSKKEGWTQSYFQEWYEGEAFVTAQITFIDRTVAKKVYDRLQQIKGKKSRLGFQRGMHIFVTQKISPDEMSRLDKVLGELNQEWTALWKQVGGLKRSMRP